VVRGPPVLSADLLEADDLLAGWIDVEDPVEQGEAPALPDLREDVVPGRRVTAG